MTANDRARADWNGPSGEAWVADADDRDAALAPVLDVLLEVAAIRAGERVLDLGCGCGATSLAAAGTAAEVLGVDLSEPMLAVARRRAAEAGVSNVTFLAGDAQTDDLGRDHDVAISRFGTMFFDDAAAAFANVDARRLCIVTWQPMAVNEWLTVPGAALAPYGRLSPTLDGPGMFAQSTPAAIDEVLRAAGFRDVDPRPVLVPYRLGADAAEATDYVSRVGLVRTLLEELDDADRARAVDDLTAAMAEHAGEDGVALGAAVFVTTAVR